MNKKLSKLLLILLLILTINFVGIDLIIKSSHDLGVFLFSFVIIILLSFLFFKSGIYDKIFSKGIYISLKVGISLSVEY